jgi:hypothetical protein
MKNPIIILIVISNCFYFSVKGQNPENCFLNDFQSKNATIPPFETDFRSTSISGVHVAINFNDTVLKVSKYIFGNAIAVWVSPDINNPAIINYLKKLSPSLVRFPGGSWSDIYFWNGNPGGLPVTLRDGNGNATSFYPVMGPNQATTFNDYLDLRAQINSQGLITINYAYARYGLSSKPAEQAAHLAANWVRADKGRTKFWEIGNESAGSWEAGWRIDPSTNKDGQPEIITGDLYGKHFKIFADSMKNAADEVGAEIYIGAQIIQFNASSDVNPNRDWNKSIFKETNGIADFYVIHNYFGGNETDPQSILNTALTSIRDMHNFIKGDIQNKNAAVLPVALTEWNTSASDNVKTSFINGMQGVLAMSEMAKLGYGMSCRWLVANWNGDGMFYHGNLAGIPEWNPRPDFFYLYYLQKFFGNYFLGSEITGTNNNIIVYPTVFASGELGIILVNKGAKDDVVEFELQNRGYGNRYYYYSLEGGTDDPVYSKQVIVNGHSPEPTRWGPLENLDKLAAKSDSINSPVKINSPKYSVQYILIETGEKSFSQVNVDSLSISAENGVSFIDADNGKLKLFANVWPSNATDNSVVWSASDSTIATVNIFGVVKALSNGSVMIKGFTTDGGKRDSILLTITNQRYEVTGLTITTAKGSKVISTKEGTLQITPKIVPENADDKSVIWSVSDTNIATISSDGILTSKKDGRVTVTCKTVDGGFTAFMIITIKNQSVSVYELHQSAFKVYPNPALNFLTIENEFSSSRYEISTIDGRVLRTIYKPATKIEIDISEFKKGIYFIRAYCERDIFNQNFLK